MANDFSEQADLRDVLQDADLNEGQRDAKRTAEDIESEGMDLLKIHENANDKLSESKHRMREASTKTENVREALEEWREWRNGEEYAEAKRDGFVDLEHFEELWELLNTSVEAWDDLGVAHLISLNLDEELLDKIDEQQMLMSEDRVVKQWQNMMELHQKTMQQVTEPMRDAAERLESVGEAVQEKAELEKQLQEKQELVDELEQRLEEFENIEDYERPVRRVSQKHDLDDSEEEVLGLLRLGWKQKDIADEVGVDESSVSKWKNKFADKNLIKS